MIRPEYQKMPCRVQRAARAAQLYPGRYIRPDVAVVRPPPCVSAVGRRPSVRQPSAGRDDRHVDLALHQLAAALDHDHRPVVQVSQALARLLALLDDLDLQSRRRAGTPA